MQKARQDYWRKRFEKLKAENHSLREKLATLKSENNNLQKVLRNNTKLFHSIPTGILLVQQGIIIDINRGALDQLGYTPEEVIGRNFLDFVHPDLKKFMRDLHKKRLSGKTVPSQYETDLVAKNGERICFEARVKRIRFNGRRAFLVNLTLLEKRKKKEKELIESKKREALITMASGLSHKLTNDLKGITQNIQHIREIADFNNEAPMNALKNIASASSEVINTTRKLDYLSKTKRDPSDDILFDLKKIVKEAVSLTTPMLKELAERGKQKINLKTYLRSVSPVEGDPSEIQDLIVNLILNAVEAMPKGGDLYLTTEENAGYAHIYIQDSGVGIPDPIKDRILDPFFSTKGKDGVGLGLSLTYAIVKRHKGEMEVTSQKDQGTTFTIRLPIASKDRKSKGRAVKKRIKNAHILIIEDEDILSELLSQVFVSRGYRVLTASSGLEGLQKLKKKEFDMILADYAAPGTGGEALVQKIRKIERELPIALMTRPLAEEEFKPIKKSAVDLIITKPLDMDKVVGQVEDLLRLKGGFR
ncbi:MAG: PAS domain S-box protein [Deltaproteobacteria bacterium]|nr:MAG: PAS domain S-box protein [Deltaproteobacteria bacterium]